MQQNTQYYNMNEDDTVNMNTEYAHKKQNNGYYTINKGYYQKNKNRNNYSNKQHQNKQNNFEEQNANETNKNNNDEVLTRPTFKNSLFDGLNKNFKDLDLCGDLYLKKLQRSEILSETQNSEISKELTNDVSEVHYDEQKEYHGKKKEKKKPHTRQNVDDIWEIATKENNGKRYNNEDKGFQHRSSNKQFKSENDYFDFEIQKMKSEEICVKKEKIVANVGTAKSIKDLFN